MRAHRGLAFGLTLLAFPYIGSGQTPLVPKLAEGNKEAEAPKLVGKSSFDIVRLSEGTVSIPMRFGNIVERSETVVLAGRTLHRERDYSMDYAAGTIFLKVQYREGQSMNVSYRYDDTKQQEGVFGSAGTSGQSGFQFQLAPGMSAMMGMGYTERLSDGTIISGNLFGLASSMKFGGGNLQGVMLMNERKKNTTMSVLGDDVQQTDIEEGTGQAIVQNFKTNALGGSLQLNYQDIDDRFAGFGGFAGAGFSQADIKAFEGEKGLKRSGFNLQGAKVGAMGFGGGLQSVGDEAGAITWRSAQANFAGVSMAWDSTVVDPGFSKFGGLREQDRGQLQKERGMERENIAMGFKGSKLESNFTMLSVRYSDDEQGLWRSQFGLKNEWLNASWMRQSVDDGFTRFGDLREGDRGQLAKERGLDRNDFTLAMSTSWLKTQYASRALMSGVGEMRSTDFEFGFGGWNMSHFTRRMDEGFGSQGSLTGEDRNNFAGGVVKMFNPDGKPTNNDLGGVNQAGIDRDGLRVAGAFGDFKTMWNRVTVDNKSGTLRFNEFAVSRGKSNLSFSSQSASDGFTGTRNLMESEQKKYGTIDGLSKTNWNFNTSIGASGKFDFESMVANSPVGGAFRQRVEFAVPNLDFNYARRGADEGFSDVMRLVDPERELFAGLLGFDQTEINANYRPKNGWDLGYRRSTASSTLFDELRDFWQFTAALSLSPNTQLSFETVQELTAKNGLDALSSQYQSFSVNQNLGAAGSVMVRQENHKFAGDEQTLPSAEKRTVAYEKQINNKTTFRTEQSETKFDDGTRTTESRNKISTELTSRVGVSVEDQQIRRDGDQPDEVRRNYGIWVDFGSGIRLDYGYNRDIQGDFHGTMNTNVGLSGGKFAGLDFGGASYKTNRWDGQRQNYFGNVSFANAVPFRLGGVSDIKFRYKTDTQRDMLRWQKELIDMGFSAALGNIGFGWEYGSQVHTDGVRAIDRAFLLTTDKTGKAPFQAALKYGVRTMPNDDSMFIRDYSLSYRANNFLSIEHKLVTNPLQDRGGVLLGSVPLDERRSTWGAKYQNDPRMKFDLSWNEIKRDNVRDELRREARFNATILADSPSPIDLTYSLQQWKRNGQSSLAHSYGISFFQRPGPNQTMSFSLEHLQWGQGRPENNPFLRDWKMRFDYSVRF